MARISPSSASFVTECGTVMAQFVVVMFLTAHCLECKHLPGSELGK